MANLRDITQLPVAESADGLNLIVNDNGVAKQIAASAVGAQADWAVTDETSPAFIKNKPAEEWDLNIDITCTFSPDNGFTPDYTVNHINTFENIKNKIFNGELLKCKAKMYEQEMSDNPSLFAVGVYEPGVMYYPENFNDNGMPEVVVFMVWGGGVGCFVILTSDNIISVGTD